MSMAKNSSYLNMACVEYSETELIVNCSIITDSS